jgi:K+/H+ antiporter YhaU regulatory subunit KhtT
LSLRANFNVTVVAIKRRVETASPTGVDTTERRVVDLPAPSSRLGADDTIILAGFDHDLERLPGA